MKYIELLKRTLPLATLFLCGCGLITHQGTVGSLLTHPKTQILDPTYKWELLKVERKRDKKTPARVAETKSPHLKGQLYALKFTLSF